MLLDPVETGRDTGQSRRHCSHVRVRIPEEAANVNAGPLAQTTVMNRFLAAVREVDAATFQRFQCPVNVCELLAFRGLGETFPQFNDVRFEGSHG